MKNFVKLFLAVGLLTIASLASAEAMKVGVVDLPKVLQSSPKVAAINKKLQSQFTPEQQKVLDQQNKVKELNNKLNSPEAAKMSADEKQKLKDSLNSEQSKLQQMAMQFQQNLTNAQTQAMQGLMNDINTTVKSIAQTQKLDIVLLKPAVIYANNPVDVTSQVLDQLPKN